MEWGTPSPHAGGRGEGGGGGMNLELLFHIAILAEMDLQGSAEGDGPPHGEVHQLLLLHPRPAQPPIIPTPPTPHCGRRGVPYIKHSIESGGLHDRW